VPQKQTTYDFAYAYAGSGPHAPSIVGERAYSYDADGNQTGWDDLTSGQRRTIVWDEDNRIREVRDNGRTTAFVYDDGGERVIKRGAQGETAYVNQFWTVRNRSVATKHIFVADTRIASKVIPGDAHLDPGSKDPFTAVLGQWWQHRAEQGWQNGQNTVKNPHYPGNGMPDILPEDNFVYFYHPDHLGSTNFATAATGDLFEHLEYFPFGETWVAEQTNTQRLPFLFTSKELDEETQLYYYGARYYDARQSQWLSTDPALAGYLTSDIGGGLKNPASLSLYSYAGNDPLRFVDPTGKVTYDASGDKWTADPGDSLEQIASDTGFQVGELEALNPRFTRMSLTGGQNIQLPRDKRIVALEEAAKSIDRTDYAYSAKKGNFSSNTNKCNLFVNDTVEKTGAKFPKRTNFWGNEAGPVTAGTLGDSTAKLPGLSVVPDSDKKIGDVVAWKRTDFSDATGHTAIYAGNVGILAKDGTVYRDATGGAIGAGNNSVNYRTMSYLAAHKYINPVFRRIGR
jgi:RHS repeat-associated protein